MHYCDRGWQVVTLDEEDRHVISDDIPIALCGVEADCETTDITRRVGAAAKTIDSRETLRTERY